MNARLCGYDDMTTRIERALVLLAYCIELDGDVHLPLYAKLEIELEAVLQQRDARKRARERLEGFVAMGLTQGDPLKELEFQFK